MPSVTIEGPKIQDVNAKRKLVKELTDALVHAYSLPREVMIVLIKENPPDNVGVGGELIIDRMKSRKE